MVKMITRRCNHCTKELFSYTGAEAWWLMLRADGHGDVPTGEPADARHVCNECYREMIILLGQERHRKSRERAQARVQKSLDAEEAWLVTDGLGPLSKYQPASTGAQE